MNEVTYQDRVLSLDEARNIVLVDGKEDTRNRFSPCFVNHEDTGTTEFIGFNDSKEGKFITITGIVKDSIQIEDVKL